MKKNIVAVLALGVMLSGCGQQQPPSSSPSSSETAKSMSPSMPAATKMDTGAASARMEHTIEEGIQHLQDGDLEDAIRSFDEAIRENPADPQPYLVLGQTYMRLRDYSRAVDTLSAALRVAPDNGGIHYLLAVNQGLLGDLAAARASAQKSVEIFTAQKDEANFKQALALLQGLMNTQDAETSAASEPVSPTMDVQP